MTRLHKLFAMSWKKQMLIFVVLAGIGAGGRWGYQHFYASETDGDDYISNDMEVTKGEVINALTMNGRAKFSNMQKLTFPQAGRITAVYKKVGDFVKAGEIIAKMDTYEIDNELEQAKIELENEQRALEKAADTSKKELDILGAEKKYQALLYEQKNAPTSLQLALQAIENEFLNKKNEYEKAVNDYEKKLKSYETKNKTYEEILTMDKSNLILHADELLKNKVENLKFTADGVRKELDALDKVMHYTDKYGQTKPDYLMYIGAKDMSTKNKVETFFWQLLSSSNMVYDWANSGMNQLSFSSTPSAEVAIKTQLIQQYEQLRELAEKKTELSLAVEKMFDASIQSEGTSWTSVTITDGRALKTTANTAIDEILGLASPETIGEKRKQELEDLMIELGKMKQELEKSKIENSQLETEKVKKIADTKMDYEMKDLQVRIAKTELDDLKKGDNEEVKRARNNIKQKQKQIETIMKKYDAFTLKANFDGVITKMNLQLWDTVGSNSSSSTTEERSVSIENPDNLEIQLDVDQSDVMKLVPGMSVQISLDALPDSAYTGTLVEIDTTAAGDSNSYWGATTYKAKIVFTKNPDDTILGAMTATVTIVLEEAYEVITVPNIAISQGSDGSSVVMKVDNGKYKKTPIEVWISDQANTQVLSGLNVGDIIMGVFIDKEGIDAAGLNDVKKEEFGGVMTL